MKTKDDIKNRIAELNKKTAELGRALEVLFEVYKNNSPSEPVSATIDILGSLKGSLHSETATLEWVLKDYDEDEFVNYEELMKMLPQK